MKDKKNLAAWLDRLIGNQCSYSTVAMATGYNKNYLCELVKKYIVGGENALVHKNRGRIPANKLKPDLRQRIVLLYSMEDSDMNFNFFQELLEDEHGISISYTALYKLLTSAGYRSPEAHAKKKKRVHRPRQRKEFRGELIQIDGCEHQWFLKSNNDRAYYTIHGSIDDATGQITSLVMRHTECLDGYLTMFKESVDFLGGCPLSIYSDRASCFVKNPNDAKELTIEEQLEGLHESHTQWQRMLRELGVKQILAWSPQAKGRIERLWHTLQGRLPRLFARNHICNMDDANRFLKQYIDKYNKKFAHDPLKQERVVKQAPDNFMDILCLQYQRRITMSNTVSFDGYKFLVDGRGVAAKKCMIHIGFGNFFCSVNGKKYPLKLMDRYSGSSGQYPNLIAKFMEAYLYSYCKEKSA